MKTKYIIPSFAFYDRTGIQRYLEKQAGKGWLLDKASNFYWRFRRIEPKQLHFAVTYFPHADMYDPAPSEAEETFREFCAHGGWVLAGANAQMQIFYSEAADPMPIETDPVMEVENIHKSMKKGVLTAYWLLIFNCVLQFVAHGINPANGLVNYLSSGLHLFLMLTWIVLFLVGLCRLLCYYLWRRKAKAAAERDGVFVETRSMAWVENFVAMLVFGGIIGLILTLEDRRMAVMLGWCFALAIVMIIIVELFRRWMKYMGFDAADSKKYTMIASVVLALVLCFGGIPAVGSYVLNNNAHESEDPAKLSLTIWDLLEDEEEAYGTMVLKDQESILLGYQQIYQHTEGAVISPTLEYNLVEVKADFLYHRCLDELMGVPVYMKGGKYQSIDPAPWGAEQAWQLHDGEELRKWYVLCYEDTILELIPSWEMTAAQMAVVGEIFG